ncbi:hypothetical protein ACO0LM_00530 [Undibacterium sp. Di26W]|uniref:hypothetical protein n=1 Tax=Undibacterium sp. Di26W TaxID=3413035 RepID=UPI003BEFF293
MKTNIFSPLVLAASLLSACTGSSNDKMDVAHEIFSRHASDATIVIESGTEKMFEKGNGLYYVCGRATVNQPGLARDLVQRFIITVNPDKRGMTRYESTENGRVEDKEFLSWWAERCQGYVLPVAGTAK